jgi:hypothetical protein
MQKGLETEAFPRVGIGLDCHDIDRAEPFRTLVYVKTNRLTFSQRLEAVTLDRGVMNENIFTVFSGDETESLGFVKPLNCSFCHTKHLLSS